MFEKKLLKLERFGRKRPNYCLSRLILMIISMMANLI